MNRNDLPAPNMTCVICDHKYRACKKCIELRTRGIEAWRMHCDCPECYHIYILINEDPEKVTREEYDRVMNTELPDGRKPNNEVKEKLNAIKKSLDYSSYRNDTSKDSDAKKDNNKPTNNKYKMFVKTKM